MGRSIFIPFPLSYGWVSSADNKEQGTDKNEGLGKVFFQQKSEVVEICSSIGGDTNKNGTSLFKQTDTKNAKQKQAYLVHAILNDGIHFVFVQSSYPIFSTKQSHVSFWKASCYFWKVLSENFTDMFVRFIVFNEIPY